MKITYAIAHAAGQDAGNASMKAADRTQWNEDDYNAAARVVEGLMIEVLGGQIEMVATFNTSENATSPDEAAK